MFFGMVKKRKYFFYLLLYRGFKVYWDKVLKYFCKKFFVCLYIRVLKYCENFNIFKFVLF